MSVDKKDNENKKNRRGAETDINIEEAEREIPSEEQFLLQGLCRI